MGTIIKLAIFAIVILVGLKIFAPEIYESTTDKISETTGVDKNTIDNNINKVTKIAVDGAEKLTDAAKNSIEDVKEKASE